MGTTDRSVRAVLGVAAVLVSWWIGFGSLGGILLLVLAGVMLVTAAVGYCPTYQLLHVSTYPTPHRISKSEAKVAVHH
ncbi:MAG TPA: DUF2892 domain-containing protein [Jiangellaceae bacterium]|nr:DUF2892 domain-containing protein [Jiangellaceae bacterium]